MQPRAVRVSPSVVSHKLSQTRALHTLHYTCHMSRTRVQAPTDQHCTVGASCIMDCDPHERASMFLCVVKELCPNHLALVALS